MAVTLPMHVQFHNARLQLCSIFLNAICVVTVVVNFFNFGQYGKLVQLEGNVQVMPDYTRNASTISRDGNLHDVCNSLKLSAHWYDAKGNRYGNHTCLPICVLSSSNPCVKRKEAVFSEGADTVFVATQIQHRINLSSPVQNYFVSSAEAVSMHLIVDYRWPRVSSYSYSSIPKWESHSSSKDAHVHFINKDEQEVMSFAPGSAIILTVSDMLHLAGVGSLDTVEPLAGFSHMPGAHTAGVAGPTRRLTGMRLNVQVDCGSGGDTQKCVAQIVAEPASWISDSTFCNLFAGDDSYRTCRGVRIKSVFGGVRRLLDFNAIFINICSSVFFLQLPKAMICVTALYLCGQLSNVYRNVVHRRFNIATEAGAMAMRLLQHEVAFNELEAVSNNGALSGNISKAAVGDSLHHILERRQSFDDVVIKHMTDFALTEVTQDFEYMGDHDGGAFRAFVVMACEGLHQLGENIKESLGMVKHYAEHSNLQLDVDKFTAACTSWEPISFDNLVKLFDRDRKVSFMERFFMPNYFGVTLDQIRRKHLQQARADQDVNSRESTKSKLVKMKSFVGRIQEEVSEDHHRIDTMQEGISEEHKKLDTMQEEVSEERRQMNLMTEKVGALTLRLDEVECKLGSMQTRDVQERVSEERSKIDALTEKPDALTPRLDELQHVHEFAQLQAPHQAVSGERRKIDIMTGQIEALALRLEEQQRKHEFEQLQDRQEIRGLKEQMFQVTQVPVSKGRLDIEAECSSTSIQLQALHQVVSEERHKIDIMIGQVESLNLRLKEQKCKHESEQLQGQQEIRGLKEQMSRVTQVLVSKGRQRECSSTSMSKGSMTVLDNVQSKGHQGAKDLSCTAVDSMQSTQKDGRSTGLQDTDPVSSWYQSIWEDVAKSR